jgi:ketosteroid isomerase-like protein
MSIRAPLIRFTAMTTTRDVVQAYFDAWTHNRVAEAHAQLAADLEFTGPSAKIHGADAFLPALTRFAAMTKSARAIELIVEGDRAALLYDCELPEPVGMLRIASFFRVEDGKIRTYETWFDATEFRKLGVK